MLKWQVHIYTWGGIFNMELFSKKKEERLTKRNIYHILESVQGNDIKIWHQKSKHPRGGVASRIQSETNC